MRFLHYACNEHVVKTAFRLAGPGFLLFFFGIQNAASDIIVTDETADRVAATVIDVGIGQGKTVIVVRDGPGFYSTIIPAFFLNEALILMGDVMEKLVQAAYHGRKNNRILFA